MTEREGRGGRGRDAVCINTKYVICNLRLCPDVNTWPERLRGDSDWSYYDWRKGKLKSLKTACWCQHHSSQSAQETCRWEVTSVDSPERLSRTPAGRLPCTWARLATATGLHSLQLRVHTCNLIWGESRLWAAAAGGTVHIPGLDIQRLQLLIGAEAWHEEDGSPFRGCGLLYVILRPVITLLLSSCISVPGGVKIPLW